MKSIKHTIAAAAIAALAAAPAAADEVWSMATSWGGGPFPGGRRQGLCEARQHPDRRPDHHRRVPGRHPRQGPQGLRHPSGPAWPRSAIPGWATTGASTRPPWSSPTWRAALNPEELILWLYQAGGADLWFEYRMDQFGVASIPCGIFPTEIFPAFEEADSDPRGFQGGEAAHGARGPRSRAASARPPSSFPARRCIPPIERGVIDATEWSSPSVNVPSGFHKIAKYVIMPGVHQPGATQECVFNTDA